MILVPDGDISSKNAMTVNGLIEVLRKLSPDHGDLPVLVGDDLSPIIAVYAGDQLIVEHGEGCIVLGEAVVIEGDWDSYIAQNPIDPDPANTCDN